MGVTQLGSPDWICPEQEREDICRHRTSEITPRTDHAMNGLAIIALAGPAEIASSAANHLLLRAVIAILHLNLLIHHLHDNPFASP